MTTSFIRATNCGGVAVRYERDGDHIDGPSIVINTGCGQEMRFEGKAAAELVEAMAGAVSHYERRTTELFAMRLAEAVDQCRRNLTEVPVRDALTNGGRA